MKMVWTVILLLDALTVGGGLQGLRQSVQQASARHYWPVSVEQVATTPHTHIQVTGRVKLVRHEADGDTHVVLTGVTGFAVCECIPSLPCALPKVGQRITVWGISRRDYEHGAWGEVHPVEKWAPAP